MSRENYAKTEAFFNKMTLADFTHKWFEMHNSIGEWEMSGFQPRRVVSLLVHYDPLNIPVSKMI